MVDELAEVGLIVRADGDRRRPDVVGVLTELTADLDDPVEVGPSSRLNGLGLESISIVYLIAEVQQVFGLGDALVQALRTGVGRRLPQLTVAEFAAVVSRTVAARTAAGSR